MHWSFKYSLKLKGWNTRHRSLSLCATVGWCCALDLVVWVSLRILHLTVCWCVLWAHVCVCVFLLLLLVVVLSSVGQLNQSKEKPHSNKKTQEPQSPYVFSLCIWVGAVGPLFRTFRFWFDVSDRCLCALGPRCGYRLSGPNATEAASQFQQLQNDGTHIAHWWNNQSGRQTAACDSHAYSKHTSRRKTDKPKLIWHFECAWPIIKPSLSKSLQHVVLVLAFFLMSFCS